MSKQRRLAAQEALDLLSQISSGESGDESNESDWSLDDEQETAGVETEKEDQDVQQADSETGEQLPEVVSEVDDDNANVEPQPKRGRRKAKTSEDYLSRKEFTGKDG